MPSEQAVSSPTNRAERDADVERKLQLYGIARAFKNGKMPTNEQIDVALKSFLESSFADPKSSWNAKLSAEGKHTVEAAISALHTARQVVLEKNEGNLFQEFVWHASKASAPSSLRDSDTLATENTSSTLNDNDVLQGFKNLGTLIITNGQFRKLLNDAVIILRDIGADIGSKTAEQGAKMTDKIRPSDEELGQVDEAAPDNEWKDTPDTSVLDRMKNTLGMTKDKLSETSASDVNSENAKRLANSEEGQRAREAASERADQTKDYLKKKVPKERRDKAIERLKKMVVEIQGHPDYINAVDTLLDLAERQPEQIKQAATQAQGKAKKVSQDDHLQIAKNNLITLIERFANNTSLNPLFDVIADLYTDAQNDSDLKNWFSDVDTYIRRCLRQKGFILTDAANEHYNQLYDRGSNLFSYRYKEYSDRFTDEANVLLNGFKEDPLNRELGDAVQNIFLEMGTTGGNSPAPKPALMKDLMTVIIPQTFMHAKYVPLPRIEYTDPSIDAIVENLIIESNNLFPNDIEIRHNSVTNWGRRLGQVSWNTDGSFFIHCSGIQCDLRDISYYVKRKTGFPKISDIGLADVFLGYDGLSFTIQLSTVNREVDQNEFFNVDVVDVKLKNLKVNLRKSKHKILFAIFRPLLISTLKPVIKVVLQKQIRDMFNQIDQHAYAAWLEKKRIEHDAKVAAEEVDPETGKPKATPSKYSMYTTAIKSEIFKAKEDKKHQRARSGKPQGKVNIAMTQDSSMFKNIVLPKGISSVTATKYKEMAESGDRWKSPVFSIGRKDLLPRANASLEDSYKNEKSTKPSQTAPKSTPASAAPAPTTDKNVPRAVKASSGGPGLNVGEYGSANVQTEKTVIDPSFPTMRASNKPDGVQPMRTGGSR